MVPDLDEGAVFVGRYKILRRIAAGAMGAVYEVLHVETERRRALKVMLPYTAADPDLRERFKREARIGGHIDSEHIVEVFDAGVDDDTGMPFLVMELLRGEELGKRLKRLGALPAAEVVTYLHQAAMALDRTHQASIVHRDLKPANLFLTHRDDGTPRIKVLDFGVAKLLAEGTGKLTGTAGVGTPLYMAPEQFIGEGVSPATDIYAIGMIAFALLTGKEYWIEERRRGAGVVAFALTAVKGPPEPATVRAARLGVTLPPTFDAWFGRATAPTPGARFPSAGAAVQALAAALEVAPLSDSGLRFASTATSGAQPADAAAPSSPPASAPSEPPPGSPRRLAPPVGVAAPSDPPAAPSSEPSLGSTRRLKPLVGAGAPSDPPAAPLPEPSPESPPSSAAPADAAAPSDRPVAPSSEPSPESPPSGAAPADAAAPSDPPVAPSPEPSPRSRRRLAPIAIAVVVAGALIGAAWIYKNASSGPGARGAGPAGTARTPGQTTAASPAPPRPSAPPRIDSPD